MKRPLLSPLSALLLALFLCPLMLPIRAAHAQEDTAGFWTDVDAAAVGTPLQLQPAPVRFRTLRLDVPALRNRLGEAPLEGTAAGAPVILPLPDGSFGRFAVVEAPVMAPALAARYPEIKTYAGQGLDDPAATVRLDWTPAGFHATILSPRGTVSIDPYSRGDVVHYVSFFKRDVLRQAGLPFNTPDVIDEDGMGAQIAALVAAGPTPSGAALWTYRLAVAATGEYTQFHGGTVADGMAAIVVAVNRVVGIYERELAVRMVLVPNNDLVVFTNPITDPYSNNDGFAMLAQNQATLDAVIGDANYDVGHVFSTGGGGIAGLGVPCRSGFKARGVTGLSNPTGDPFYVDFVAHEMGHQFGANHTFNGTTGNCAGGNRNAATAYEPGSGSTIMAYAGICGAQDLQPNSDDYFHTASFDEIVAYTTAGPGNNCPTVTNTGNTPPVPDAGPGGWTIPAGTPFSLIGTATDTDGDALTYNWEQFDLGPAGHPNNPVGTAPLFRSFPSQAIPERLFPQLSDIVDNTQTIGEILPTISRILTFRFTARDNRAGGGGVDYDQITLNVTDQAGPFLVTAPDTPVNWMAGTQQTVTWDVAGTAAAPVNAATVRILLSTDGGFTYPHTLAAATPNDGTEAITVPNIPETASARVKVEAADNIFFDISNTNFTIEPPAMVTIAGAVTLENPATKVAAVTMTLSGDTTLARNTNASGAYDFSVASGGSYTVTPSKTDDTPANRGVSTLDILFIRQHVLTTVPLSSPYKIIAADVNNSNTVTPLDILFIRQVILTTTTDFPGGLWRFVSSDYVFSDPTNPLAEAFAETRSYTGLVTSVTGEDFIALKHGDVNDSWVPPGAASKAGPVLAGVLRLGVQAPARVAASSVGQEVLVPVTASEFREVAAYQFTLEWDASVLSYAGLAGFGVPGLGEGHFGVHRVGEGLLTTAWDDAEARGRTLAPGSEIFSVRFRVVGAGEARVRVGSSLTEAAAYGSDLSRLAVEVEQGSAAALPTAFALEQNYPNPFNPRTEIVYGLPEAGDVRLMVYDVLGRVVAELVRGEQESGRHRATFDARALPSGIYYYRLEAGAFAETRKMVLLK